MAGDPAPARALARGGLAAVAPYGTDNSLSPASEFRGLLTLAPKAAQHFQSITKAQPIVASGKPASEAIGYWEATRVRDHTTLQLGLFAAQKAPASWQLIDCVYYPSDTYFMALDLFQLWPLDGGTLVWQVGFVSAPFPQLSRRGGSLRRGQTDDAGDGRHDQSVPD